MKKHLITRKTVLISLTIAIVISASSFMVYANSQGSPHGSIVTDDGKSYLKDEKGNTHSGWFIDFNNEQEKWLYSLNSKMPYGAMYVSTTTPDGANVDETGAKIVSTVHSLKNGWAYENGEWYYYESDVMVKDKWLNLKGKWYYVENDGSMVSGSWKEIGGKSYYFGSDGIMYANATTPDGNNVDQNGVKIINDASNNAIIYSDFIGDYIEESIWNDYADNGYKVGQSDMGATGMDWFAINKIENGYVYGDLYDKSFKFGTNELLKGIELSCNEFTTTVDFYPMPWEHDIYDSDVVGSCLVKIQLICENGVPSIIVNNVSSLPEFKNDNRPTPTFPMIFKKVEVINDSL